MGALMGFALLGLLALVLIGSVVSVVLLLSEKRSKSTLPESDE